MLEGADEKYIELLEENIDYMANTSMESLLYGTDGLYQDIKIKRMKESFELERISIPAGIYIWAGKNDEITNLLELQQIGKRIPNCHLNIIDNIGHFGAIVVSWQDAVTTLTHSLPKSNPDKIARDVFDL